MTKNTIVELVNLFDEFNAATQSVSLREFALWILRNDEQESSQKPTKNTVELDRSLAYLINRLSRYSRYYSKKILEEFNITSIDEFYLLVSIARLSNPAKNEVYEDAIFELTTGAQMMRRLIRIGFVKESPDKNDRRIKRVKLTAAGEKVRQAIFERFSESVRLKSGNLTLAEKQELLRMMQYLESFHSVIFKNDRKASIQSLIEKYIE